MARMECEQDAKQMVNLALGRMVEKGQYCPEQFDLQLIRRESCIMRERVLLERL